MFVGYYKFSDVSFYMKVPNLLTLKIKLGAKKTYFFHSSVAVEVWV